MYLFVYALTRGLLHKPDMFCHFSAYCLRESLVDIVQVSIMAAIRHPNVAMLMGLCLSPICVVTEFCARGSLTDVLRKAASDADFAQQLTWRKRVMMALDAAKVRLPPTFFMFCSCFQQQTLYVVVSSPLLV